MNDILKIDYLEKNAMPQMLNMGFTKERFNREALHVANIWNSPKNSYLRKASKASLLSSLVEIASTNLTLNPIAKESYLIPRKIKNGTDYEVVACLEPSYIGLSKLLIEGGKVKNIQTNLVYEGDDFDIDLGLETSIKHKPHYVTGTEQGSIKGVYSVANLEGGLKQFEYITIGEVYEIRSRSESYKAHLKNTYVPCVWITDEGEMVRKTCIRRISKHLPRSEHYQHAEDLLNRDFEATDGQVMVIDQLISTCTLQDNEVDNIMASLNNISANDASTIIQRLKENQVNQLQAGNIHSMAQINKEVENKVNDPNS